MVFPGGTRFPSYNTDGSSHFERSTADCRDAPATPLLSARSRCCPGDGVVAHERKIMSGGNDYNWAFHRDCRGNIGEYLEVKSSLKFYVLDLVDSRGDLTYKTLAGESGMPSAYAADRLVKYAQKGLLKRDRQKPGSLSTFELTDHGRDRLAWFRRQ